MNFKKIVSILPLLLILSSCAKLQGLNLKGVKKSNTIPLLCEYVLFLFGFFYLKKLVFS